MCVSCKYFDVEQAVADSYVNTCVYVAFILELSIIMYFIYSGLKQFSEGKLIFFSVIFVSQFFLTDFNFVSL